MILDYRLGEESATLTGKKFFFSKSHINPDWKAFPIFKSSNSLQVTGIQISHKPDDGVDYRGRKEYGYNFVRAVDIPNFNRSDYSWSSPIGSAGFKLIGTEDFTNPQGLLLVCKVNESFLDRLDNNETIEVLDRLMKVVSNLVSPPFYTKNYPSDEYPMEFH